MPPAVIGAAIVGSSVVGGISADRAADKAADASKAGIAASNALAKQARTDAINLFARGMQSAQSGIGSALNFYQNNATAKIQPFVQGNMAAQQVLGQGATQANNAILGLPVDMSFANNPQSLSADYSGIKSAQLPVLGSLPDSEAVQAAGLQPLLDAQIPEQNGSTAQPINSGLLARIRRNGGADRYNLLAQLGL